MIRIYLGSLIFKTTSDITENMVAQASGIFT